uniref:Uncharacterized protein n=1 Tax=Sphaerodactylus townsendi TaxID=933632 RepID=A0ACB8FID7_9SAUR
MSELPELGAGDGLQHWDEVTNITGDSVHLTGECIDLALGFSLLKSKMGKPSACQERAKLIDESPGYISEGCALTSVNSVDTA